VFYVRALWRSIVVLVVLVALGAAAGDALARAGVVHKPRRLAPASRVVLGSSFERVRGIYGVLESGEYLLVSTTVSTVPTVFTNTGWIVVNRRLGTTTALDPSCDAVALGPPWVLMRCPESAGQYGPYDVELYSLADGTRHVVTLSPGMPYCSSPPLDSEVDCSAVAVGADWIEWVGSSYHHLPTQVVYFQNVETGELRKDPTDATTFADLNSPALAHRTCRGVRLMRDLDSGYGMRWGSLTAYGRFALVTGTNGVAVLERCGTHMRRQLPPGSDGYSSALASTDSAIMWQADPSELSGLFLPSLQRFVIALPSAIVKPPGASEALPVGIELTSSALYVSDGWDGARWRTASPAALPLNTSRPSLTRSGDTLTCRRGRWRNAEHFSYAWRVNGIGHKDAKTTLALGKANKRRRASCSVTASNAAGTTTAWSARRRVP
jgi:hypothetical protein